MAREYILQYSSYDRILAFVIPLTTVGCSRMIISLLLRITFLESYMYLDLVYPYSKSSNESYVVVAREDLDASSSHKSYGVHGSHSNTMKNHSTNFRKVHLLFQNPKIQMVRYHQQSLDWFVLPPPHHLYYF